MRHQDQVLSLLRTQIKNEEEVKEISETAQEVASKWVGPLTGGKEETNGLIYGLVQSGKTGVLTVTGALGADEGYKTLVILTSDNDPLYDQTLGRVREAFPGIDILGKQDFKDVDGFLRRVKGGVTALVATKNSGILGTIIQNFSKGNLKGLSALIIDDEADQASLNTKERKADGTKSPINERISDLREFFDKNTYLQVTATPQSLFLQTPQHDFRPKFTVLSHPGADYVGGDEFFGDDSRLIREYSRNDIAALTAGSQPTPNHELPKSLLLALDTFMIGATFKRAKEADQNCAFLCHVSTGKNDHKHIVELLTTYKLDLASKLKSKNPAVKARLKTAYDDLATTHDGIRVTSFDDLIDKVEFFSPGITVKLVNGDTDEDVAVRSPYNLFVGGNKLGRGVTIKNLLVSYYGRHPKKPQADTVLQHARMYGYRRKDIGLLRLFLSPELHTVFKAIHKMEIGLRELIARSPNEGFRGVYVESNVTPTRRNVLAPGAIGVYSAGSNYNPAQVLRDESAGAAAQKIDKRLAEIGNKSYASFPMEQLAQLIELTIPDQSHSELVWDQVAVAESIRQLSKLKKISNGLVYVDRDRDLQASRRETQGVLSGGELGSVPKDQLVLFMFRTVRKGKQSEAWWPQIRFPDGNYAFAFAV